MSEKMFKLSTDYQRLWTLLQDGATVVYQVVFQKMKKTGFIDKAMCPDISMSVRYTGEDGLEEWRDIEMPAFISECERLNLQFFDEIEPNMFWLQGVEETPAVGMPLRIAEEIEEELGIGIVECAVRLPDRKMRVWTEENEDGDEVTKWEWVSE